MSELKRTTGISTYNHGCGPEGERRRRREAHRRELLVLIYHHLLEEGLVEAADALRNNKLNSGFWDVGHFTVCDNVDLTLVLTDYISYHQMRFNRSPALCRRIDKDQILHKNERSPSRYEQLKHTCNKSKRNLLKKRSQNSKRDQSLSNTATSSNEECDTNSNKNHVNQNQHQVTFDSVEQLAIFDSSNGTRNLTASYAATATSPTKEGINGFFLSNTFSRNEKLLNQNSEFDHPTNQNRRKSNEEFDSQHKCTVINRNRNPNNQSHRQSYPPAPNQYEDYMESSYFTIPKHMLANEETRELASIIAQDVIEINYEDGAANGCGTENSTNSSFVSWEQVVGLEDAKEALEDAIILPTKHPEIYEVASGKSFHQTGAVLLCGPPGTGKTMLARAAANELSYANGSRRGAVFINLHASSVASKWRGESEKLVRVAFELARYNSPSVLFLDEAEALLGDRGGIGEHESSRRCKAEFLVQLDGFIRYEQPFLFLASTNLPWTIDPGLLRRFQRIINVGLPPLQHRESIILNNLKTMIMEKNAWKNVDIESIAALTEGFSGSDLQRACVHATKKMLRKRVAIKDLHQQTRRTPQRHSSPHFKNVEITTEDLKEAISQVRPLNDAWKKRYEKWSINTGVLRKSIESVLPQSAHYDDEIPKSGTTPLITFTPCRPLSADTNLNQNTDFEISSRTLPNLHSRSEWKNTL